MHHLILISNWLEYQRYVRFSILPPVKRVSVRDYTVSTAYFLTKPLFFTSYPLFWSTLATSSKKKLKTQKVLQSVQRHQCHFQRWRLQPVHSSTYCLYSTKHFGHQETWWYPVWSGTNCWYDADNPWQSHGPLGGQSRTSGSVSFHHSSCLCKYLDISCGHLV